MKRDYICALRTRPERSRRTSGDVIQIARYQCLNGSRRAGNQDHIRSKAVLCQNPRVSGDPKHSLTRVDGNMCQGQFLRRNWNRDQNADQQCSVE